ncbi:hypothetical protein [Morganella psychrotolerans]|uniref:hypothetical protein n=1 Tax=Morganella psychrotolerans TaxID=368603 RepID=UPI000ACFF5C0|nr:hypothetical protein [Morganella psychrotolerans]
MLLTPNIIDRCNLYIKSSEHAPAIIFKAEVFSLPNITVQGGGFLIFRSHTFSLIMDLYDDKNNNNDTCKIKLIQDQFTSVLDLVKTLKSLRLLHNNKGVFLGVDFKGYWQLTINFVKSNINSQIFNIIEPLENIIYKFELGSEHKTTFDYLASDYNTIIAISKIITNDTTDMVFTDNSITDKDVTHLEIPYFRYIELNNIIVGVSCFIQTERTSESNFTVTGFTDVDCFMFLNKSELDGYIQELNNNIKKNSKKHT